ncbi:MAG: ribonuclease P protein component [Planctomycetota bacterium]|nr:ribonuclease P protein component [Planctomycetota bacterium]
MNQHADRKFRVTRRKDILRLFDGGRRSADGCITLLAAPNELGHARMGVAVGLRHGNAVRRNRIKRLCREAFRLVRNELPAGWDYMMLPRIGADYTLLGLQASLRTLAPRATESGRSKAVDS